MNILGIETKRTFNFSDAVFDLLNLAIMIIVLLVTSYPLYFTVIASFSDPHYIDSGKVVFWIKGFQTEGYNRIFRYPMIYRAYFNTIFYTAAGTFVNVFLTLTAGYSISEKNLPGRRAIMFIMTFTLLFSGGLIPLYIIVKAFRMLDTFWAMFIPGAVGVWYVIIAKTFFETTIPEELKDAAYLDGCSKFKLFTKIILPLSRAILAVMVIFYAVGHWNDFFSGLIFLSTSNKYPLQNLLRDLVLANQITTVQQFTVRMEDQVDRSYMAQTIKYGIIVVSVLPILMIYPFLQKYFAKGVMLGSLKG